jgi:hypothetical protein
MRVSASLLALGLGVSVFMAHPVMARAQSAMDPNIVLVADGCGPGWYRGPGGACHRFGYGPYPNGYYSHPAGWYAPPAYGPDGCPAGWWRGPWGHCRNTPYHGRLPNGMWQ